MVVDRLARLAKDWDTRVWTNEATSCIKDILAFEACLWINSHFIYKKDIFYLNAYMSKIKS